MNLKELIAKGESETLEFKKSLSEWREIVETVSAFSNTCLLYTSPSPRDRG